MTNETTETREATPASTAVESESKLFAFLCYFLGIIGVLIVLLAKKDDQFAVYHAKQGLVVFICGAIVGMVGVVPILGWIIAPLVGMVLFVIAVLGMVNALTGQAKPLPIIGQYADKFNF